MADRVQPEGLVLTEEEAFALLSLCLTSPNRLDKTSEKALHKLAEYCSQSNHFSWHQELQPTTSE